MWEELIRIVTPEGRNRISDGIDKREVEQYAPAH